MVYYGDIKLQSYKTSLPQVSMTSDRALEKFYCTHILADTKTCHKRLRKLSSSISCNQSWDNLVTCNLSYIIFITF